LTVILETNVIRAIDGDLVWQQARQVAGILAPGFRENKQSSLFLFRAVVE
jgi:hypothetical protein